MAGFVRRWLRGLFGVFSGSNRSHADPIASAGRTGVGVVRRQDGWTVAELEGDIDTDRSGKLRAALSPWVRSAAGGVIVNLRGVASMDSPALATLVACGRELPSAAARLRLCCLSPRVRALMEITGLDRVLDVFATEDDALKAA